MVSAGGQDAWVLKRAWNVESSQELSLHRLKSCEGMRKAHKGGGHLAGIREQNSCRQHGAWAMKFCFG